METEAEKFERLEGFSFRTLNKKISQNSKFNLIAEFISIKGKSSERNC